MKAGNILTALGLSALVGGMLFFGAVMAPLVFTKLPLDVAGPFIRAAFPFYYAYMIVSAGIGVVGFLCRGEKVSAIVLLMVALVTVWLWAWFIPHLDALRAAGNMVAFNRGHGMSVWIDGAQLIVALGLLVRTAVK
jgi:Domain of unknown function (DUF4149)